MELFEVGGCVRDGILGLPSKDIDFTCVLEQADIDAYSAHNQFTPFEYMAEYLKGQGFKIFVETPEFLTIRAQFPPKDIRPSDNAINHYSFANSRLTADFVLARKESGYTDGRRPDKVEPGSLLDDLSRRDFTMNAIARDMNSTLIDPFDGQKDIADGIIRCVGEPFERFTEDALRAVRALRFSVTKGFHIHPSVQFAMQNAAVLDAIAYKISDERIKDELSKMFRFDTVASVIALNQYPALTRAMFSGTVSLDATMKTKGRGK